MIENENEEINIFLFSFLCTRIFNTAHSKRIKIALS